ncbi:tRNA N6-adenosine threonylcarbamoyltransferase [Zancudomyces culisetae]|uniref:tRNA N6-adenosine threonylcarbamoyltransferase n=1 Tax=Zancudomyces culisetae TaxID=1213189 RepID=A0A1R1PWA7_ZANCU|nr:tRNA N6-adenosine threonylcarbamoyltransferase [Zancudomyces culisetae]|eukprot:OMH85172.1 tRNA N6-adenosine threonylcarbamoyltransferase [Zancudomyces culisetae]
MKKIITIGFEGSANKLGVGIVEHRYAENQDFDITKENEVSPNEVIVLSNVRDTYNPPAGQGFLPKDTAAHHRNWIVKLTTMAIEEAKLTAADINAVCYTKGL